MHVHRPRPRLLRTFASLAVGFALLAPSVASASRWYLPRIELGVAATNTSPLADFVRLQNRPAGGFDEERVMEFENATTTSLRIDFELHPELRFGWTRSWSSSDLRFAIDGQDLKTGDENPRTGQPVSVPSFDVTVDVLTFRWWPTSTRWNGIGPTVTFGAGRVSQEQDGVFAPDNEVRSFDWSADDFALIAGVGLEGSWKKVRGALFADVTRWRYEAPDEDVNGVEVDDVKIPIETVVALSFGVRISAGF